MHQLTSLVLLSALAGAVHVMSPDHWVPASLFTWQRRWPLRRTLLFVLYALGLHLGLGLAVYFAFDEWLLSLDPHRMIVLSMGMVFGVMILRSVRFSGIQKVQQLGPHRWWGLVAVVSLLGPCESLIPVLMKSRMLGYGYFVPFLAFSVGTLTAGAGLIASGRIVWNRPFGLPRLLSWVDRRVAVLPIAAGLILGLRFLLRLS